MWEFFIVFLLLIMAVFYKRNKDYEFWKHIMAIPGPTDHPVIGTLLDVISDAENMFIMDRNRAKTYYPIFKVWFFNTAAVGIFNPEDMELVMSNMKHNDKGLLYGFLHDWLKNGLLTSTGSHWQKRRKMLTPAFHFSILEGFVSVFNRETKILVEVLAQKCDEPYIDVVNPITEFTLESIGETSLGRQLNKFEGSSVYKKSIYEMGDVLTHRIVRPWIHPWILYRLSPTGRKAKTLVKILHNFSTKVIDERKKLYDTNGIKSYSTRKRMALLDLLLAVKYEEGSIDDEGIREEVDTFMFEGHDTTSMAICYALMALANEKTIQEEIVKEINEILGDSEITPTYNDLMELKFMERCIKECLRLYPSVPVIARNAGEDIKTSTGYTIPKGCDILMYIYDLHHNPNVWEDPEKFDPDRFLPENIANRHPFAYVPFSAGPRNCIGQRFAILEIKAALCGILRKFKLEAVDTPQTLKFKADLVLRPLGKIKVKFVLRD